MAWVKSHQEIRQHPKTRRLARLLGISVPQAVGHLHLLWWWAVDYAGDGDLSDYDAYDIADAAMWEGDPEGWVAALVTAGYIDRQEGGSLVLHDWNEYQGNYIEKREKATKRKRKSRASHNDVTRDTSVTDAGHDVLDRDLDLDKTREEQKHQQQQHADAREELPLQPIERDQAGFVAVKDAVEKATGRLTTEFQVSKLLLFALDDGLDIALILRAIEQAAMGGKDMRYAASILRSWRDKGIRTPALADAEHEEFRLREGVARGEDRDYSRSRAGPAPAPTVGQAYREIRLSRQNAQGV